MALNVPHDPKDLDIYDNFVVPDWVDPTKKFSDLTPQQQKEVLDAYRFSGFRPGLYQGITGLSHTS